MGCDYYIVKLLDVKYIDDHDDEQSLIIELERQRCYFYEYDDDFDSDDTDNSITFKKRYGKYLTVTYEPKILFQNNKWRNERLEDKYSNQIQNEISNGLISVIKKEERYLR